MDTLYTSYRSIYSTPHTGQSTVPLILVNLQYLHLFVLDASRDSFSEPSRRRASASDLRRLCEMGVRAREAVTSSSYSSIESITNVVSTTRVGGRDLLQSCCDQSTYERHQPLDSGRCQRIVPIVTGNSSEYCRSMRRASRTCRLILRWIHFSVLHVLYRGKERSTFSLAHLGTIVTVLLQMFK